MEINLKETQSKFPDLKLADVSVVIPCHNSELTIARAVKSIFDQTLIPYEIILVDDASTDGTVTIMNELKKERLGHLIHIIQLGKNMAVSYARNTGWRAASGKYIAFLDSDDSWHSKKIEIQYNYMEANPKTVITGHDFNFGDPLPVNDNFKVSFWPFSKVVIKNPSVTPSLMVLRNIDTKFNEGRSDMEDHLLIMEITQKYGPLHKILLPLAQLYKPQYGTSGLSSRMWRMEMGCQKNYLFLQRQGFISISYRYLLSILSILRFLKRLFVVYCLRKLLPKRT